jgi:hypothetical protein
MTDEDYEDRRRQLDRELLTGIELLQQSHRVKLQALEDVRRPSPVGEAPAAAEPAPAPPPAAPKPVRARLGSGEALDDIQTALDRLGDEFARDELILALGYRPSRSTLHRALSWLQVEGIIERVQTSSGRSPARYRKL